jgi:UPF0755 protein
MKSSLRRYIILFTAVAASAVILAGYSIFFGKAVKVTGGKSVLYIPEGAAIEQVMDSLKSVFDIRNPVLLKWIAVKKNYPARIRPGRYVFEHNLSYNCLVNVLRSGAQSPVKVTFNNIRNIYQLASKVGGQIEADSADLAGFLSNPDNYRNDGFTTETFISVFIPNTYELYWNTSAEDFYERMLKEYDRFWTKERQAKAAEKKLTRVEVAILASIIDDEVLKPEEKPRIAGVYLNRIRLGIPLQACPTIKFALNDFTITRVLNKYLEVDSPYNTYKHRGFPPGPIGCPSIEGIDAVLNAEKHDYLYFAARADFSGYHNFSRTLREHNRYAAEYQKQLDRRRIYR